MRDENEKNENDFLNETDDILSFMQNYSEDEKKDSNIAENNVYEYEMDNQDSEMEDTDDDLLALLDMISAQEENSQGNNNVITSNKREETKIEKDPESFGKESKSIESISIENENPSFDDDLMAINDLLGDEAINFNEESNLKEDKKNTPNDMGGIFSDVLSAVDTLKDKPQVNLNESSNNDNTDETGENSKGNKEKKKGLFQKIFGKREQTKENEPIEPVESNLKNSDIDKKSAEKKAEAKKEAEKKKAEKIAKQKSKKTKISNSEENGTEVKKKAAKKKDVKKKASVKKEKKVKKKEKVASAATDALEDADDNVKLNKVAVIFVMTFFILIGGFVIIGTNLYSYSLNIKNANVAFSRQRYSEAYDDIYGLDIRKKDSKIYEKIMTVMYVNKELSSCKINYDMKKYPEALDSLLKGLRRYDKYIDCATKLGIDKDMNFVKKQIIKELKDKFSLSEKEAIALNKSDDQTKYSLNVINTALENNN